MKNRILQVVLVALALGLNSSCSSDMKEERSHSGVTNDFSEVVVEFTTLAGGLRFSVTDEPTITRIREWVTAVLPRQPRPELTGAVAPWCYITFLADEPGVGAKKEEVTIYLAQDRHDSVTRVTAQEKSRFVGIFGMEWVEPEPMAME